MNYVLLFDMAVVTFVSLMRAFELSCIFNMMEGVYAYCRARQVSFPVVWVGILDTL